MSKKIEILGAGVAGLCAATELTNRNISVDLVDPVGDPGPHACSWWAGGMLAPYCEGESAPNVVVKLGKSASNWWTANGCTVFDNGSLVLALSRDRSSLKQFQSKTVGSSVLDSDEIEYLEPDLGNKFSSGLFFKNESHLTPRLALRSLRSQLSEKNVSFKKSREANNYTYTIDCRGLAARDSMSDLRGVKGEMLVLRNPEIKLSRPVRLLHPRIPLYIVPRGNGIFMVGATMIENSDRKNATVRSVFELLSSAFALNPMFGEAEIVEIGVDSRPAFSDNTPRIRKHKKTIHINGLYRHGFLLAPAMAVMLADFIEYGTIPEVMDENIC